MRIKDINGKYELVIEVNGGKSVVHEIINDVDNGLWAEEDFKRMHNDYVTRVAPVVKGKNWIKCSDVRRYKTSLIVPEMSKHLEWASANGMGKGCIITDNVINKMQIERGAGGKGSPICPTVFITKEEAYDWLKAQGYRA